MRHGVEDMNTTDGMFKVKLGYEGKMRSSGEGGRWRGAKRGKSNGGIESNSGAKCNRRG